VYMGQGGLWFVGGEESSGRATYRRRFRAEIPAVAGADSGQAGSGGLLAARRSSCGVEVVRGVEGRRGRGGAGNSVLRSK